MSSIPINFAARSLPRGQVTAKTAKIRNNYMPRFVFYPKIRFLFIENRFLHKIRKSASLGLLD